MAIALASLLPGWFTLDAEPHLLGARCTACGTYSFPARDGFCGNPGCAGDSFEQVELSRTGILWSFTAAGYQPPPPYASAEPFVPFAIAAVELAQERMIILGQVANGVGPDELSIGASMELVLETVPDAADPAGKLVWKWKPQGELRP